MKQADKGPMYSPGCGKEQPAEMAIFYDFLRRKGASENTIHVYMASVRLYHRLYQDVTAENLRLFKSWLIKHYKPSTVNTRIYAINQYAASLSLTAEKLPCIKMHDCVFLENVISNEDYCRLKDGLRRDKNMRWYFVVRFLAATGVRVSELLQIKAEHVRMGYFDLCSKGGKMRRIYFPESLRQEALPWLQEAGLNTGFIFTNRRGAPITPRGIHSQLKVLAKRYGIPEKTVYPHAFRHRFAINFLDKFNDISLLADLLGHDSVETTKIYLTKSSEEQRELIDSIVTW